jgi:hypothetical protein
MAAPTKTGLDYFPFSVNLLDDEKLRDVHMKYNSLAELTYIKLLTMIYRDKGYYLNYSEPYTVAAHIKSSLYSNGTEKVSTKTIENVVNGLARAGMFDATAFKLSFITSSRIQQTWYSATVERKNVTVDERIWLLSLEEMKSLSSKHSLYVNWSHKNDSRPINPVNRPINPSKSSDLSVKEKIVIVNKLNTQNIPLNVNVRENAEKNIFCVEKNNLHDNAVNFDSPALKNETGKNGQELYSMPLTDNPMRFSPIEDDSPTMRLVREKITDKTIVDAIRNYVCTRLNRGIITDEIQMQLLLAKLFQLSTNIETQLEIINNATLGNWKSFYPIDKKPKNAKTTQPVTINNDSYREGSFQ